MKFTNQAKSGNADNCSRFLYAAFSDMAQLNRGFGDVRNNTKGGSRSTYLSVSSQPFVTCHSSGPSYQASYFSCGSSQIPDPRTWQCPATQPHTAPRTFGSASKNIVAPNVFFPPSPVPSRFGTGAAFNGEYSMGVFVGCILYSTGLPASYSGFKELSCPT